jgi:hypothetical protein
VCQILIEGHIHNFFLSHAKLIYLKNIGHNHGDTTELPELCVLQGLKNSLYSLFGIFSISDMYHQLNILIFKRQNIQIYLCIIPYIKQDTGIAGYEILVGNYEGT